MVRLRCGGGGGWEGGGLTSQKISIIIIRFTLSSSRGCRAIVTPQTARITLVTLANLVSESFVTHHFGTA